MRNAISWSCYLSPLLAVILAAAGCGSDGGGAAVTPLAATFANRVTAYAPVVGTATTVVDWPFFFAPQLALGAPGDVFDVVSLGFDAGLADSTGGTLVLGLGDAADSSDRHCLVDGTGADLVVYENPFVTTNPDTSAPGTNNEVATVEVSSDGVTWFGFAHAIDSGKTLADPTRYSGFAGVTPTSDGGDRFDLAGLIAANGLAADYQACFVRLMDGGTRYADFGNSQTDLYSSGADIDAVEGLNAVAAPGLTP